MQVKTGKQLHVFARGSDGGVDLTDDSNKHSLSEYTYDDYLEDYELDFWGFDGVPDDL